MTSRMSLVEQKRLQWAKEREEMARLSEHWNASKPPNPIYPAIRNRISSREHQNSNRKPLRASGHYGSTASLKSLETSSTSLQSLDFSNTSGSMINIHDRTEVPGSIRRRSPSLPPIYTKEHRHHQAYSSQELPNLEVEGSRYINQPRLQKHQNRELDRTILTNSYEEREGETSGYGSDSIEPVIQTADVKRLLPLEKAHGDSEMAQRTWRNPYCESPDASSLPSSRKFSGTRLGELNRPRWGSIWGQENATSDLPPPPSWLERGLSRLDHSSQVLVINHDSASSPDSSTTGSTGSDSKTYLRGQNIPVDAEILQEREARRQKALELQSAIKQQLEEKDRQRKEERERKLREELEEEERIKRERDKEKERFEEEQRKLKEKENAKLKKEEAMKEILENAERLAKEKKRQKRQRDDSSPTTKSSQSEMKPEEKHNGAEVKTENEISSKKLVESDEKAANCDDKSNEESKNDDTKESLMRLNREVAIVLTGRLEDSNCLQGTNVQLLNLIVNPNLHQENNSSGVNINFNALIKSLTTSGVLRNTSGTSISPRLVENRLLTPSKYRIPSGRDFGTQTDVENEIHELGNKENCKERKDVSNNRRDIEKSMNMAIEEKNLSRSKSQPRTSLESRPRWNANRPGTRYRTQSEKDPHYQRRMRLRRRRVESSDERSRSPSPDRRKMTNIKSKIPNPIHRKSKLDNYDADMSMDSLNSVVPLRVNEHGQIIVQTDKTTNNSRLIGNCRSEDDVKGIEFNEKNKMWCGQEILSQLNSLKNGLLSKQQEWDSERCLVSPSNDFY
ncbi:myb-like protein X [Chelonus insularis]|uniref:myb-like protein X n=1 Tax=Chelonus insularis TaxID=460826 RepID=UPI00158F429E|nr:myb-like protein X [Chelonus insularis]